MGYDQGHHDGTTRTFDGWASSTERMQTRFGISPRRRHSVHTSAAHNQEFDYLTYPDYPDVVHHVPAQESEYEEQAQERSVMDAEPQQNSGQTPQEQMDSLRIDILNANQNMWEMMAQMGTELSSLIPDDS
jgi:hypothetical protein